MTAVANALKQLQDYANGLSVAAPTLSTYSNLGLREDSGRPLVTSSNLASINSVLASAAVTSGQIPTVEAVRTLVVTYNAILSWANGAFADVGSGPQASVYSSLGVSLGSLANNTNNFTLFNAIVGGRVRSQVDTVPELQALANATIKLQSVIAGSSSGASLTVAELQLVGLTGVTSQNLAFVVNALAAQADDGSATLSLSSLQTVVSRASAARAAIMAYANNDDGNQATFPQPTKAQYADAGFTLTDAQVTALNSALKTLTVIGSGVDTPTELVAIKDILDKVQAMAGNSSSTSTLSKSELATIGIVVDDVSYTAAGNTVTSNVAGLVTQAFKAQAGLTLPTVQDMERWVDVLERVMKLVATGDAATSTLTLQELKSFGLVPAQVTGSISTVLTTMVNGFEAGTGIKQREYSSFDSLRTGIEAALTPVVTVTSVDDADNSAFDTGFSVRSGASVTVTVDDGALDQTALESKFTIVTANGLDIYTAKVDAFTGTEKVKVNASYTTANGITVNAAQVTLQAIDTSAPAAPLNVGFVDSSDGAPGNNQDGVTNNGSLSTPSNLETGATVEYRITKDGVTGQWQTSYTAPKTDGTADGAYRVEVRQKDLAGNVSNTQTVSFTLDATAPSVTLTELLHQADATKSRGFTVTAGAVVQVYVAGSNTALTAEELNARFTKTTGAGVDTYLVKPGVFVGTESFRVSASLMDKAGNNGTAEMTGTKNLLSEFLSITPIADPDASVSNVYAAGFSVEAGAVVTVKVRSQEVNLSEYFVQTTVNNRDVYTAISGKFNGQDAVLVNATILLNGVTFNAPAVTLTIDTTGPAAPTVSLPNDTGAGLPGQNQDRITQVADLNVVGEDNARNQYRVSKKGDGGSYAPVTEWVNSYTAPSEDGDYQVEVRQIDQAGNQGSTQTFTFTRDTTAPEITISSTIATDNIIGQTEASTGFAVSGTTTAEVGQKVLVRLDGPTAQPKEATVQAGTGGLNTWTVNFAAADLPKDADGKILDGPISFVAEVKDAAGNEGGGASGAVTVDATVTGFFLSSAVPQELDISQLGSGKFIVGGEVAEEGTVTVRWKNSSGQVVATKTQSVSGIDGGAWEIEFNAADIPKGSVSFEVSFKDKNNNTASLPTQSINVIETTLIEGSIMAGPLTGNPGGDLTVDAYDASGALLGSTSVAANGTYSLTINKVGPVVLRVRDKDPADSEVPTYRDEASGQAKAMPELLAVVNIEQQGTSLKVNITPLTDLAAKMSGVTGDYKAPALSAIATNNAAVAQLFLGEADLLATTPLATVDTQGGATGNANLYGAVLHTLSQMEQSGNKTTAQLVQELASSISIAGGVATLSNAMATTVQSTANGLVPANKITAAQAARIYDLVDVDDLGSIGAITGTATQNATLTAGTITDLDGGVTNIVYQWQSSAGGTNWSNITGATASTFVLTQAQVGQQVRVVATYNDAQGSGKSVTSAATAAVANVNDAPVLDATASPSLGTVLSSAGAPTGAVGTLVSSLVIGITDADAGATKGIAITAVDSAVGTLYYSINGGTSWSAVGTVSDSQALLLASDANTRLYLQPNSSFAGQSVSALTVRAWDGTNDTPGSRISITASGGITPFSTATDTVAVTVSDVTRPTLDLDNSLAGVNYTFNAASAGVAYSVDNGSSNLTAAVLRDASAISELKVNINTAVAVTSGEALSLGGVSIPLSGTVPASVSLGGITWGVSLASGVLTFTAPAGGVTASSAQSLLRSLTYSYTTAPTSARTFSWTAIDAAGNTSDAAVSTIGFDTVGPVVDLNGAAAGLDLTATTVTSSNAATGVTLSSNTSATVTETNKVASVKVGVSGLPNGASEKLVVGSTALNADGSGLPATVSDGANTWGVAYSSGTFSFTLANATATQAQALVRSLQYRNSAATLNDGLRSFSISAVDEFGQSSASAAVSSVLVNANLPTAAASPNLVTLDANGDGVKGDQFTIAFSEMVEVSKVTNTANWTLSSGSLGTGASITAIGPVTVGSSTYASSYRVTAGSGYSYTTGTTFTIGAANVVDSGGSAATANVVFTMTDIVAPEAPTPPVSISTDNYVNAAEKAAATTMAFSHTAATAGEKLNLYIDGVLAKTVTMTAAATSTNISLSGADWGSSDGVNSLTARIEDAAGNLGSASAPKSVTVDTALSGGAASMRLSTDAGTLGQANAGDVVTVTFNEAVRLTAGGLPTVFGTDATATAVGAVNGFASTWQITLGSSPSLTGSTGTITFRGVTDAAGNGSTSTTNAAGDLSVSAPADVLDIPQITQIGNVTSDNVLSSAEVTASQSITLSLAGAKSGDVVKLYMDGVQVGSDYVLGASEASSQSLSASVAANGWGADGERVLTASIQRSSGTLGQAPMRHVYIAADGGHWSNSAGTNAVLWFDPETLVLNQRVGQGTASIAGTNDYMASVGGARAYALSTTRQPIAAVLGNGRTALVLDGDDILWMTAPTGFTPTSGNSVGFISAIGVSTGSTGFNYLTTMGISGGSPHNVLLLGQRDTSTNTGIWSSDMFTTNAVNLNTWAQLSYYQTPSTTGLVNATAWSSNGFLNSMTLTSNITALSTSWAGVIGGSVDVSSFWRGTLGDTVYVSSAISANYRAEINLYQAAKYGSVGKAVTTSSDGVYDLSTSTAGSTLIDQVLDRSAVGALADTVVTAGSDYVQTGAGDDTVRIKDLAFRHIDAGVGNDKLAFDSGYSGASTIVLADLVSNARGMSGNATADARVNAAGYHKLMGFEQIDLSGSTAAQSLAVAAADVNQLSESNTLGVVLGANDSITASGFASTSATWGYYSYNNVVYDQRWTQTSGADTYTLYARGGALPSFSQVAGATNAADTLSGTSGNDLLQGGQGNDTLSGGAGADIFRFIKDELGADTITDFDKSQGDKLDLSQLLGGAGMDGSLASSVGQYLQLSRVGTGNDAVLKVDVDGLGDFAAPELSISFSGGWVSGNLSADSLTKLIDDRVILA